MSKKTTNPKTYHPTRVLSFSSEVQDSHRVMPLASHSPVNKSMNESTSDSSVKQLDHHEEGQALLERSRRPTQPPGALESMMNHNHNNSLMETTPPRKFDMLSFQKEESSLNSNQSHMNNNNNDVVSSISLTNTFNVFGHHNSSSRNHIHGSPLSSMGGVYEMNNNNANFVGYMNSNTSPSNPQHLSGASSLAGFYGLSHLSSNQQNNHNNNNTNPIDPNDSPPNPQEDDTVNLGSVNNSFDHTNNLYCYSVTSSLLDNSGRTYLSSTYKLCSSMASSLSSQQELSLHPVNSNTSNGDLCGGPSPAVPSLPGESSNNTNCFYRLGKRGKVPKYVRFLVKHRHARKQNGVSNNNNNNNKEKRKELISRVKNILHIHGGSRRKKGTNASADDAHLTESTADTDEEERISSLLYFKDVDGEALMTIDRLLRKELIKASRNIKNHRNWSRQMPHYYSSTAELEASRPEETKDFYIPSLISIIDPDSVEKNGASVVNRYRGGFHLSDYYCPAYHVPTEHPANKGKREDDKSDTTSLSSYSYYYYTDEEESNQNETNNKSVSTVLSDTFADKKEKWFFYTLHRRKNKFSRNYVFTNRHENFKNNTFSAFPSESVLEAISHNNNNHNEDSVYSFCSCSFCNYRHDKKLNYSFANMDEYEEVEPATRSNNFNFFVKRNIKTLKKKRKPSHGVKPKESNVRVFRVNSGEVFYYDPTSKSKHQPKREGEKEKAILAEAILFNKERRKQQREKRKFYFTRGVQTWRALNRFRHKDTKMKKNPIVCHHAQGIDFSLFCRSPVQRSREDSTGLQRNVSNNTVNNNDSLSSCTNLSISTITNNNNSTVRVENMLPTFKKHESFKKEKIEKPNGPGGSILNHLDVSPPPKPPSRSSFHTTTANNNVTSTDGVLTFTPRRRNKVKVTSPSQPLSHDPNNNDSTIVSFGDLPHYNNTEGNYHRRGKSFDGSFKVSFSSQFVTQTGNPNNANNTKSKIKSVPPPNRIELPSHLSNSNRASLSSLMPYYRMGKEEDCSASYISRERTLDSFTSPGYHLPLNSSSRRGSHLCVPGIESIAFLNLNQKSGSANNNGGDGNSNSNRFRRREVTTETLLSTATSTYPTEVEDTLLSLCLSEGANNEEDISSTNVSLGL